MTYFVAVAEELHFGRAAERLHLAGPSLSQQISNLERELGTQLLVRDRRHVELTPAGSQFLIDAREVLSAAERAFDRARKGGGELPLRLGYVSWLPPEAVANCTTLGSEWTNGSSPHTRKRCGFSEGSLDLAIAWIEVADVERYNLTPHLLWYERLEAVVPRAHQATRHESVPAAEITVLIDVDEVVVVVESLRLGLRQGQPRVGDRYRRRRHRRACILRPRRPVAAAGARFAEAPRGAHAPDIDPATRPIPGTRMGLGAPSSRR